MRGRVLSLSMREAAQLFESTKWKFYEVDEDDSRTVVKQMQMNAPDDPRALTARVRADVKPADLEVAEFMRYLKETRA